MSMRASILRWRVPGLRGIPFALWLAGTLASCLGWVLAARFTVAGRVAFQDLQVFRFATDLALRHGWTSVYDTSIYLPAARAAFGPSIQPLYEPPTMGPIWLLLQPIPWPAAAWVWLAVGLAAVAGSALVVSWDLPPSRRLALVAAFLAFYPAWFAVTQGQVTPLVLLGLAAAYRLLRGGRPVLAGLALAVASLKPQMVFLVPLALLVLGRWRVLASAAAATAVWASFSVAVVGPAASRDWAAELLSRSVQALAQSNTATYYLPGGATPFLFAATAVAVAFVAWRLRSAPNRLELAIAAALLGSILATPYANPQDFSGWLLAGVLIWRANPRAWLAVTLGALYFLLNPFGWFVVPSPAVMVETAALVGLCLAAWRARSPQTIPSSQRASSVIRSGVQGGS